MDGKAEKKRSEAKIEPVPYLYFESVTARFERINKRMFVALLAALGVAAGSEIIICRYLFRK